MEGSPINNASDSFPPGLQCLNAVAAPRAEAEFMKCCGSPNWARRLMMERPFASFEQLVETADKIWWALSEQDWLQAFHSHPKIGEKKAAATTSPQAQQWSATEQAGTHHAAAETMDELADLNRAYEEKFGFIFIICATGKSSDEMLANLRERMNNVTGEELRTAAAEQAKITKLRLEKLVATFKP